jgi:hypothetical protein
MLDDAQVPVLLTQQHLIEALPEHHATVVCFDADWKAIAQASRKNPEQKHCSSHTPPLRASHSESM